MTREEIIEGLKLLEDNMVYFDELLNDKGEYIDVHELLFEVIEVLEQEPCEDCISRQAVMDALCDGCELFHRNGEQTCLTKCEEYHFLATLPSIQPKPKTGHWTISPNDCFVSCSECGLHGDKGIYKHYRWCPNCGAKMESEG